MRVAIAGKGGAGKTSIASTLVRLLARDGTSVVAIDADSNPNLSAALGVDRDDVGDATFLPSSLASRRLTGPSLTEPVASVLERYSIAGPDGVRVLLMGMPAHADEGCLCSAHATVSALLHDLGESPMITIIDMEASPEHLSRGTTRHVDVLLLVAEPYYRALETVRRLAALAAELPIPRLGVVANKVRTGDDLEAVREFCARHDLDLTGHIPWSDSVTEADRRGVPIIDQQGTEAVTTSVRLLAEKLLTSDVAGGP